MQSLRKRIWAQTKHDIAFPLLEGAALLSGVKKKKKEKGSASFTTPAAY